MSAAKRSQKLAARVWWATLPYYGWMGHEEGAVPAPWYAYPLAWLHRLADRLPSSYPFEPVEPTVCNCDYCLGLTDEWTP